MMTCAQPPPGASLSLYHAQPFRRDLRPPDAAPRSHLPTPEFPPLRASVSRRAGMPSCLAILPILTFLASLVPRAPKPTPQTLAPLALLTAGHAHDDRIPSKRAGEPAVIVGGLGDG